MTAAAKSFTECRALDRISDAAMPDAWRVRTMVLRQVGLMTLVGGLIGVAGAIGLGKMAASMLFEIKGYDPLVLIASALLLSMVSLAAGYLPAMRASRIDPIQALRYE